MSDILDEAVEAAARVMADDGWTCEYHEPGEDCTVCREAHRHTAIAILAAAAPIIRRQVAEEIAEALADEAGRVSDEEGAGAAAEHAITGAVGAYWGRAGHRPADRRKQCLLTT